MEVGRKGAEFISNDKHLLTHKYTLIQFNDKSNKKTRHYSYKRLTIRANLLQTELRMRGIFFRNFEIKPVFAICAMFKTADHSRLQI